MPPRIFAGAFVKDPAADVDCSINRNSDRQYYERSSIVAAATCATPT